MLKLKKVDTFPLIVELKYPQEKGFVTGRFKATARWYPRDKFEELIAKMQSGEIDKREALDAMIVLDSWELYHEEDGERYTADEILNDVYLESAIASAYSMAHVDALGKTLRRSR